MTIEEVEARAKKAVAKLLADNPFRANSFMFTAELAWRMGFYAGLEENSIISLDTAQEKV